MIRDLEPHFRRILIRNQCLINMQKEQYEIINPSQPNNDALK